MARTAEDYKQLLKSLLPRGPVWPGGEAGDQPNWDALLDVSSEEWARIDARALGLLEENDPSTAVETLPDWLRLFVAADDPTDTSALTTEEIRGIILAKLRRRRDPTLANIQAIADGFNNGAVVAVGSSIATFPVYGAAVYGDHYYGAGWLSTVFITYNGPQSPAFEATMIASIPLHLTTVFEVV